MTAPIEQRIRQKLAEIKLPSGKPVLTALKSLQANAGCVTLVLELTYPLSLNFKHEILRHLSLNQTVDMQVALKVEPHIARSEVKAVSGIKNIIGVASGKGGVGKSTTAVNLALALSALGARIGLLDADVYGPSQPHMVGVKQKPELSQENKLIPIERFGIKTMSMGYLVEETTPMAWRGPMISAALKQLLNETVWGALDYMIVDLPPGTGDIQLTLTKNTPLSGAIIVTTPQDVALLDVRRAAALFEKMAVPVFGVIENMATYICRQCGHQEALFGVGGGESVAAELGVDLLGKIPLTLAVRQSGDSGIPVVAGEPDSDVAVAYADSAMRMAAVLANQPKSYAHHFNNIRVEKE